MMTGKNLSDEQLQQIVDKTINYLDKVSEFGTKWHVFKYVFLLFQDADGRISFEEFKQLVETNGSLGQVTSRMTVEI